jgi:hypothetical protein
MSVRAAFVLALAAGALLAGTVSTPSGAAVAAKGKCKRGQALVKLGATKRCQPLGSAIPRPQTGDQRLSIVESAVTFDPSALRDRDGKQLPSPAEVYGSFGPGAYDAIKRELPRALGSLDRLTKPGAAWRVLAAHSSAAACPSPGSATPARSDGYRSDLGGGVTLTVTAAAGSSSSITLGLEKGADGLTVELDLGQCEEQQGFKAASCPTAAGIVEGTYNSYVRTVTTVRKGGVVTYSLSLRIKQVTKLHGQVGEDAKLDSLAIDDSVRIESTLAGTSRVPVSFTATVKRQTRVDMHTGNYDPGAASLLDVAVDVDGVSNDAEAVAAVAGSLQRSSGKDFAEAVARAIKEYRQRESGWNKPNACATLRFAPGSQTLHLQTGQSGRLTGRVEATRGGASLGRWRLVGRQNATYSPQDAQGLAPVFGFHVTRAGRNVTVSATFHVTSKAGVAEGTWSQGTRGQPPYPKRFVGHATFDTDVHWTGDVRGEDRASYTMDVTFVHDVKSRVWYGVGGGTIAWTRSGHSEQDGASCSWQASGSAPLRERIAVLTLGWDERAGIFRATFSASEGAASYLMTTNCSSGSTQSEEGVFSPLFPLSRHTDGFAVNAKDLTFSGSDSDSVSSDDATATHSWAWDFKGVR